MLLGHPVSTFQDHPFLESRRKSLHGDFTECAALDLAVLVVVLGDAPCPATLFLRCLFLLEDFLFIVFLVFELGLVVRHGVLGEHQFRM